MLCLQNTQKCKWSIRNCPQIVPRFHSRPIKWDSLQGWKDLCFHCWLWLRLFKVRTRSCFSPSFFPQAKRAKVSWAHLVESFTSFQEGGGVLWQFGTLFIAWNLGPGCNIISYPLSRLQVPIQRLGEIAKDTGWRVRSHSVDWVSHCGWQKWVTEKGVIRTVRRSFDWWPYLMGWILSSTTPHFICWSPNKPADTLIFRLSCSRTEKTNFCCLSEPIYGILSWQP